MTAPFGDIYSVRIVIRGNKNNENNNYTLPANLQILGKVVSMWLGGQIVVISF